MFSGKKHLYIIIGSFVVGIAAILIVYFAMISTGLIQTTKNHLIITTGDAEKAYDGTPLTFDDWSLTEGELPKDYKVEVTVTGSRTEAGEAENLATAVVYDSQGADVTSKYEIEYLYGKLTVLPMELQYFTQNVSKEYDGTPLVTEHVEKSFGELLEGHTCNISAYGERTEIGESETACEWTVTDADGADVSLNYNVVYTPGVVTVTKRALSIYSEDIEKVYDGTPLSSEHYELVGGSLLDGHKINVSVRGSRTDVGISETVLVTEIRDENGVDVSSLYEVNYHAGKLIVTGRPITIRTIEATKVYDGTPLTYDGWELFGGELLEGHTVTATPVGSITMVGETENLAGVRVTDADGKDVTRNYEVSFEYGMLTVTGIPINVYSYDAQKEYDGTPLTEPRTPECTDILLPGHTLVAEAIGSQTEVGRSYNWIRAKVKDEAGYDVTACYDIILNHGILSVIEPQSETNSDEYAIINSTTGGDIYLRENAYGNYMNGTWYAQKQKYKISESINPVYLPTEAFKNDNSLAIGTLSVTLWRSTASYLMPYYCSTYSAEPDDDVSPDVEFVKNQPYTVDMVYYDYSTETIGKYKVGSEYAALEADYAKFVKENYLSVDESVKDRLMKLAVENGITADSPTLVEDIITYMRGAAKYKVGLSTPEGEDAILYFLEERKEGKCTDFAGAATLIFRLFGVPARISTGFLVLDVPANTDVTVKTENAHAWTEIYIDGVGWVCVDPTPDGGGARGGNAIPVKPIDIARYWTAEAEPLTHSGEIYNKLGIIATIKAKLGLNPLDEVTLESEVESPTIVEPVMADVVIKTFKVLLNGEVVYEFSEGEEKLNELGVRFAFLSGYLKYYKYKITVSTSGIQSKEYDGTEMVFDSTLFDIGWGIESEADPTIMPSAFQISCNMSSPAAMVNAGRYYIAVSDVAVQTAIAESDYHIVYDYAYAEITRKSIVIKVSDDGTYYAEGLLVGHVLSSCDIDFENNVFNIVLQDMNGEDVTGNYTVILDIF